MRLNVKLSFIINVLLLIFITSGQFPPSVCNARECAFVAKHGMTHQQATDELTLRREQRFTLRTLDGYHDGQQSLFVGLWEKCANEVFRYYVVSTLTYEVLEAQLITRKLNGFCLDFINAYNLPNDAQRYIAMWTHRNGNCGDLTEVAVDITDDVYQQLFDTLTASGYRIHWLSGSKDETDNIPKYTAIFKKGIQYNFQSYHGLTSQDLQEEFGKWTQSGYRMIWRNGFMVNGLARFNVLFEKSPGRRFASRSGLISPKYQCVFDNYFYSGWAPKHVTGYGDGTPSTSIRYGGIWELDTMSWEDLQWIDQKINDIRDKFPMYDDPLNPLNTMAISVGISIFGKTVFAKGYGKAAIIDANEDACPNTMYRTASLGKSLTSAGILYLNQTGLLSLDEFVFGWNGILTPSMGYILPDTDITTISSGEPSGITSIRVSHLLPHLSRLKRKKFSSSILTSAATVKDALDDDDLLLDGDIGNDYGYSNLGYNILAEIIAAKVSPPSGSNIDTLVSQAPGNTYEQWIRNNILAPSGIDISRSHSPKLGSQDPAERREWEEAQYHPPGSSWTNNEDNPHFLEVYAGAGGWIMSPLQMLKFIARIDGFSKVTDILDDERIALLEEANEVQNCYSKGGGWSRTSTSSSCAAGEKTGRGHTGSWDMGTRTAMRLRLNGKAGVMMANYNNGEDLSDSDLIEDTLDDILDNKDIKWPCWTNNDISKTFSTETGDSDSPGEFGFELIIDERADVITQQEVRILTADLGNTTNGDDVEGTENDDPDGGPVNATLVTPVQRRNPVAVVADFELCRSDTSLCDLDTMECWDGSLVGRDPNNDCEFYECPDVNAVSIECASDRLQCDDGTIVRRNASLGCEFNECPPCDGTTRDDTTIPPVGRRLLHIK